jgi:two-component system CheB/CheR fusion protein
VIESGSPVERRVHHTGGAHYLMRILPYRARNDTIDGALVTFVDVTKLVEAEAQQRKLVEDLNHRVRNLLAVVGAIAKQTLATAKDPAEFNEVFIGRLQAMSRGYVLVSREQWGEIGLNDILESELSALKDGRKDRVTIKGGRVTFKPEAAIALGLVFHEFVANATKHGALSEPKGQIDVSWAIETQSKPSLLIRWEENAGKSIDKPKRKGFGTELIERELKSALAGTVKFDYEPRGLKVRISIPADPKRLSVAGP